MKNKILLTVCLLALFGFSFGSRDTENAVSEEKTVTVCCTPDVQPIAETFIREYSKSNGNLNFQVKPVSADRFSEAINRENSLGFISENVTTSQPTDLWKMLVARLIIVPVTHAENPNLKRLEERGISAKELQQSMRENAVNICVLGDESAEHCLAQFLKVDPASVAAIKVTTKEEMIQKLRNDKTAVGFCCLLNVSEKQDELAANFKILPIDKNENGRVDYHETVYQPLTEAQKNSGNLSVHEAAFGSLDVFERGVWIGKYPRSLVNDLYLVSAGFPEDSKVSEFVAWAVTDGQQFMDGTDYSQLVYSERQSKLNDLQPREIVAGTAAQQETAATKSVLYVIAGLIGIALIIGIVVSYRKRKSKGLLNVYPGSTKVLNEENIEIPNGIYFDKTHTWTFMEKDGSVKIGIDDFMQQVTGEYTNIKMKKPGERIMKNEPLVTLVQDGKQIEIYAPVSGKIKEINEDLVTDPSEINKSPYSEGWIYSIEPSNWQREISFMKMADSYKSWLKNEFKRLKDFLAVSANAENKNQVAFQEGGELNNHVLKQFGPRVWEDFQKNFIDTSDLS